MENERNKRLEDHNNMLNAQRRILQAHNHRSALKNDIGVNNEKILNYEKQLATYEKQIEDKVCLINELLKRIKDLTTELNEYKARI